MPWVESIGPFAFEGSITPRRVEAHRYLAEGRRIEGAHNQWRFAAQRFGASVQAVAKIGERWLFATSDGLVAASEGYVGALERIGETDAVQNDAHAVLQLVPLHVGSLPLVDRRGQLWITRGRALERIELPMGARALAAVGADERTVFVLASNQLLWRGDFGGAALRWARVVEPFSAVSRLELYGSRVVLMALGGCGYEWSNGRWVSVRDDALRERLPIRYSPELRAALPVFQRRDGRTLFADGVERSASRGAGSSNASSPRSGRMFVGSNIASLACNYAVEISGGTKVGPRSSSSFARTRTDVGRAQR
ncbi:MAG: hypothetical protein JNK05_25345 [Myxococcales bacterium]|nr:hypothetical protein [Myxococcales bacterium]